MIIDAHQHFWSVGRGDYGWLTPAVGRIYRDYGPADLEPLRAAAGVGRTILVQAAPTEAESAWLLDVARHAPEVAGVVGWIDFDADDAASRVAASARDRSIVGLRPMMQDLPDDDWMLGPGPQRALAAMSAHGLVFDALIKPRHLSRVIVLAERHPDLTIVVDHGAKPDIASRNLEPWRSDMAALAQRRNVMVKVSGLVTEARADWTVSDLAPYVTHLVDTFGPDRLMWGSDWPVLELAGTYDRWYAAARSLLGALPTAEQDAVFGGTAARIYLDRRGTT